MRHRSVCRERTTSPCCNCNCNYNGLLTVNVAKLTGPEICNAFKNGVRLNFVSECSLRSKTCTEKSCFIRVNTCCNKKVSYRKQIALQRLCHKKIWAGLVRWKRGRACENFHVTYFDHHAKFGCQKIWLAYQF